MCYSNISKAITKERVTTSQSLSDLTLNFGKMVSDAVFNVQLWAIWLLLQNSGSISVLLSSNKFMLAIITCNLRSWTV